MPYADLLILLHHENLWRELAVEYRHVLSQLDDFIQHLDPHVDAYVRAHLEASMPHYLKRQELGEWLWHNCTGSQWIGEYRLESLDVLDRWFGEEVPHIRAYLRTIDAESLLDA